MIFEHKTYKGMICTPYWVCRSCQYWSYTKNAAQNHYDKHHGGLETQFKAENTKEESVKEVKKNEDKYMMRRSENITTIIIL